MGNYTIGYLISSDGGPQCFGRNTITGAPSQDKAVALFQATMKYAQIEWCVAISNEEDFVCPVSYDEMEQK
jgi:hypothetical protein